MDSFKVQEETEGEKTKQTNKPKKPSGLYPKMGIHSYPRAQKHSH
jgi:hypothetical protein